MKFEVRRYNALRTIVQQFRKPITGPSRNFSIEFFIFENTNTRKQKFFETSPKFRSLFFQIFFFTFFGSNIITVFYFVDKSFKPSSSETKFSTRMLVNASKSDRSRGKFARDPNDLKCNYSRVQTFLTSSSRSLRKPRSSSFSIVPLLSCKRS